MPRPLSAPLLAALYAQESGEVLIVLLTLTHADLAAPMRFSADAAVTTSRGNSFLPVPVAFTLPGDKPDELAQVQVTIDAIDRTMIAAVRACSSAPDVLVELVLASSPDTVEASFSFSLRDVTYDAYAVTGTLGYEQILNEPFPGDQVTPSTLPGVFK